MSFYGQFLRFSSFSFLLILENITPRLCAWAATDPVMPDAHTVVGTVRSTASTVIDNLSSVLVALFAVAFPSGWSAFWLAVARRHYAQGDLVSAASVTGLFVVTVLGAAVTYAIRRIGVDASVPVVGGSATSS